MRDPASKSHHIEACLTPAVEYAKTTGFERYEFVNQAVAAVALGEITLEQPFFGKILRAPLMIAPMTGGVEYAHTLNLRLAAAAEHFGLAMGVGSQRVGLEKPERAAFFKLRSAAPTAFLFANLGGAQLCQGWGVDEARRAIEMIEADALFIHLNPIQEACQGGDVDFRGLLPRLAKLCTALEREGVPVLVREVGFGLSGAAATALREAGVSGLDCAGAGGTSWAKVEALCAKTPRRRQLGELFGEWGIPTAESLRQVCEAAPELPVIATGGLRSGQDLAKALALGARLGAMARPFLCAAAEDRVHHFIETLLEELRVTMFGIGATSLSQLRGTRHLAQAVPKTC